MTLSDHFLFISHVTENRATAVEIVDALERRGMRCWIAPRDIRPGMPFDDAIVTAIESCRAMLLIFSDHCNDSEYIRREVTVAGESGKTVIPFRIQDVQPRKGLRVRLADLHWIDEFDSRERAIEELIKTVSQPVSPLDASAARPLQAPQAPAKLGNLPNQATRFLGRDRVLADKSEAAAPTKAPAAAMAPAADSVKDNPSIVVLPFTNMSGDPEQDFFADGMTEDILTELSRFRHLFVISRNSSFVYKGKALNVRDVARELGVQYVVEGSVRKAGSRVRVTVQLIEADTDRHLWAERYDRQLEDIFAIQDELTSAIVAILPGRVEAAAHERVKRKPPDNLVAYEYVLAGKLLHHRSAQDANVEALRMMDRALALDPKYAHARAWRGCILGQSWVYGWCKDRDATFAEVWKEMEVALALDENDSDVHRILAAASLIRKDHDRSLYHQERALALNPNDDLIVVQQGELLTWLGRPEEGIEWIKKAMLLNPYHPERFWNHLGRAYFVARRYADAVTAFKHISAPDHTHHAFLAGCYAAMGEAAMAQAHAADVLKRAPDFSLARYGTTLHYKHQSDLAHHREALLKAGLLE